MDIVSVTNGAASGGFTSPNQAATKPAALEQPAENKASTASQNKPHSVEQTLEDATKALNEHMDLVSVNFKFSIDQSTHQIVVKVINHDTGELIRQIPSEEALKIAKAIDILNGVIIQKNA